jgi:hypothetical protein
MNASTWIELAGLVLGGGGGGTAVAKLTRLAVAVERVAEDVKAIVSDAKETRDKVQEHEIRLAKGGL